MVTSEIGHFLRALRNSAHFACARTSSPVQNQLQWIRLDRFVQAYSACAIPSGTLPFPLNCFFPKFQLSGLPSLPYYTRSIHFVLQIVLQKLFQFDKVIISTNSVNSDGQFSRKFSMRLVDPVVLFIINYKKYRKVLLSKRNYYAFA